MLKQSSVVDIKHTGDVLTPQQGTHDLEDLERIYVDLEHLDDSYDALGFEANVFSKDMTFQDLDSAYVRLVNADTNQEIMRCALDGSSELGKRLMSQKILLLTKLFRNKDRWVIQAAMDPREQAQRLDQLTGVNQEFILDSNAGAKDIMNNNKVIPGPDSGPSPQKMEGRQHREGGAHAFMIGAVAVGTSLCYYNYIRRVG